ALPLLPALPAAATPATQAPGFYRFKLGSYVVTTVHDGSRVVPLQGFVRNAPLEEVQKELTAVYLPTDGLRIPFTITVVDTGRQLIVFDTGNGPQAAGAPIGRFDENFRAAGLDPAKVALVVLSHFHGDHIGGLVTAESGMAFPNAELVVPATEWAWWTDEGNVTRSPEGQRGTFANTAKRFAPYQGRVRQLAAGAEAAPGIRSVPAYGHTPGHTCFIIADGNDQMMFVADATNRPELLARRPDFHIIYDFDVEAAETARRRIYDQVAADRMRVTGFHFPFPATGWMAKEGAGYRFVPADWSAGI
ncbi:MAG TPA: MBL fold metallo-hydrolase, partial [Crenalkalicoccus sp.]|nr:MBL fold metallo-hydrolase [Crenalkalicoccus sp.]